MPDLAGLADVSRSEKPSLLLSNSQARAKARLRAWKRNREKWAKQSTFRAQRYLVLVGDGHAHPYQLDPVLRRDLRMVASARALDLLEHILACERAFGAKGGVVMSHEHSAALLACSRRTAGDAARELQELGLVEMRPWFVALTVDEDPSGRQLSVVERALVQVSGRGKNKHREVTPRYVTTKRARALVEAYARNKQVGKNRQPGRNPVPSGNKKESRGRGRPGLAFAAGLRWKSQESAVAAALAPKTKARVVMHLGDGRVALGSPLHGDAGLLVKQAGLPRRQSPDSVDFDDSPERALAWAAFEAMQATRDN